jgi:hypothetical protein
MPSGQLSTFVLFLGSKPTLRIASRISLSPIAPRIFSKNLRLLKPLYANEVGRIDEYAHICRKINFLSENFAVNHYAASVGLDDATDDLEHIGFPHPLVPIMPTVFPAGTESELLSRTSAPENDLDTFLTSMHSHVNPSYFSVSP